MTAEEIRLEEAKARRAHWQRWGPYLSERTWGTVREDYSPGGSAWEYLPHDHARSKAYRWNDDGLGGICDRHQHICFAIALWNGCDPILKERLFGLTGNEGNHGEDVKECYFYLDSTPTHSYMKFLYKYPQIAFPYRQLVEESRRRGKLDAEFELLDTGAFAENRYFDVVVEYAKSDPDDILIRIQAINRGTEAARLDLMPTIWFRNTWSWGRAENRPLLKRACGWPGSVRAAENIQGIELSPESLGRRWLACEGTPQLLFTENDTNTRRLYGLACGYAKDGIHDYVLYNNDRAVNPDHAGTKAAVRYSIYLDPGETRVFQLRLFHSESRGELFGATFDRIFADRKREADELFATVIPSSVSGDARNVMRQAFAGLLWSKQFYHYVVKDWLSGDPGCAPPAPERLAGRNHEWNHLYNSDVLSIPDKWEYPWYAAWDLAFHCVTLALVDAEFAKQQLVLLLREWYMHPNGQLPAYEWSFSDVNPPVHAWAA